MKDCLFCKISKKEIPAHIVWENDQLIAFLDIKPINPGHMLLIPKEHCSSLLDAPEDILSQVMPVAKKLAQALKEGTGCEGVGIGMNNGEAAGQEVFHAHVHIIPRKENDGYKMWQGKEYKSSDESRDIAEKIKKHIK